MLHAFLAILFGAASATAAAKEYRLASGGATAYRIILPEDAIPAEKTPVRALHEHLKQMTGADLPVAPLAEIGNGPNIAIAFNPSLPA